MTPLLERGVGALLAIVCEPQQQPAQVVEAEVIEILRAPLGAPPSPAPCHFASRVSRAVPLEPRRGPRAGPGLDSSSQSI